MGETREPYPTEILRDKYRPLEEFCAENSIPLEVIQKMIEDKKISHTEFRKSPNIRRRFTHINPDEVWRELGKEQ